MHCQPRLDFLHTCRVVHGSGVTEVACNISTEQWDENTSLLLVHFHHQPITNNLKYSSIIASLITNYSVVSQTKVRARASY